MSDLSRRCDQSALIQIYEWTQGPNSFNARLTKTLEEYAKLNPHLTLVGRDVDCAIENIIGQMYEEVGIDIPCE